jgi:hypothetical protein
MLPLRRTLQWTPVVLGLMLLLSLAWMQRGRALRGQNDFAQLYAGAKLADTAGLYSRTANLETIGAAIGLTMDTVVYTRPPFYAVLLKPLAAFPYRWAYAVFSLGTLASILWFVIRFTKECSALPTLAAFSIPVMATLCNGQDTPFLLVTIGVSMLLTRSGRDFLAGLVMALCAIKFHLFLFLPLLWLLKKRWRLLAGGVCGTVTLILTGALFAGPDSTRQYIHVLRDPWINPSATGMPNLHGLVAALALGNGVELGLIAAVVVAFVWITTQTDNYEFLLAVGLVCGLLVSYHSGIADDLILFPVLVLVYRSCEDVPLRALAGLILTPIPYFLVLAGAPYSAAFAVLLLVLLSLAGWALARRHVQKRQNAPADSGLLAAH